LGCGEECAVGFLEGDEAGGELEECEVVLVFLAPADEDAAVSDVPIDVKCGGDDVCWWRLLWSG
jgi:hypothetical protein